MQPRVLIVTTEAPDILFSGLGFFNEKFWIELKRQNYPFKVLYLNNQKTRPSQLADYEVNVGAALPFDSTPESLCLNLAWTTRNRIQHVLDDYAPDIISAHENSSILPFFFELEKVQFTLHSSYIGMQHYWEQRLAVRQSGAVILHSHWAHRSVLEHVSEDISNLSIMPIGVDFNDYPSQKIAHPQGKIVISFFGRFTDFVKNFQIFREAIVTLPEKYKNQIEARVYGPEKIPDYLINEGFKGLTYVQGEAKKQALAETDIVVFPSLKESFGIIGLEALLSNCALIATPGLGMDDYMPQESACPSNVASIKARLIDYIENPNQLRQNQVGQIYRKSVERPEFSIQQMAKGYIDVWQQLYSRLQKDKK